MKNNTSTSSDFDLSSFWSEIDRDVERAGAIVSRFDDLATASMWEQPDEDHYDEERDMLERELGWILRRLRFRLLMAGDVLGAATFIRDFESGWEKYKDITSLDALPWVGALHCPALDHVRDALETVSLCLPRPQANQRPSEHDFELLERILEGSAKIVTDRKIEPKNEAQVRRAVYDVLIHVFPDTVREIPISQVSKTYKPDIGIRRLRAAIEYKFADSEDELKKCIGGIYEDIRGYAGSADWTTFYAVLYCTEPYMTRHQVEAEWQLVGVPHVWKPILVVGKGNRVRKSAGAQVANVPEKQVEAEKAGP